ncbi:MAG TPA: deoxyribodipyrimidine photo-lyase, partial [Saprospiraceae bacterium]|nr:deoxyribodipyrimidine photo-lyase [Saprospiraceae bacterium]
MSTSIYWFRNDQRLQDNPALWQACQLNDQLLYCFVVDERWEKNYRSLSFPNMSDVRMQFCQQSVQNLAEKLEANGAKLIVRKGNPVKEVLKLARENDIHQVYASKEPGYYERRQEKNLTEEIEAHFMDSGSIFDPEDLDRLLGEKSRSFTSFRKKVEKKLSPRKIIKEINLKPSPELASVSEDWNEIELNLPEKAAFKLPGGADSAQDRLQDYVWKTKSLGQYKKTRNGLIGENYSS